MELMARENGSADLWAPALARGVESIVFDEKA
jgi:hypothetical protein